MRDSLSLSAAKMAALQIKKAIKSLLQNYYIVSLKREHITHCHPERSEETKYAFHFYTNQKRQSPPLEGMVGFVVVADIGDVGTVKPVSYDSARFAQHDNGAYLNGAKIRRFLGVFQEAHKI